MIKEFIKRTPFIAVINYFYGLKSRYEVKFKVPSYEEKRAILSDYASAYNLVRLVETGTFLGDTVEYFRHSFQQVYSIELSEELAANAKERFKEAANVKIIQGNSGEVLKDLIKEIGAPTLYWLDGHYSSEFFMGEKFIKTARADKDTPVESELQTLLNDVHQHVILIDDARFFNGKADYPRYSTICEMVKKSPFLFSVSRKRDIIRIVPIK